MGSGHVPQELPSYQHELVRLHKHGTPVGELIATVLTLGQQADRKLGEQFDGEVGYCGMVQQLRELIGE